MLKDDILIRIFCKKRFGYIKVQMASYTFTVYVILHIRLSYSPANGFFACATFRRNRFSH